MTYNVLVLKSDEHNPRMVRSAGHPFIQTPNLDRLAARGVSYDAAYCPSPLCTPSRSSYLSGRPVHEIQCYNNSMAVERPNFPSYGSLLSAAGVHSALVGKVHAYRPPEELGFAHMQGKMFNRIGDTHIARNPLALRDTADRLRGVGVDGDAFHTDDQRMGQALEFLDTATDPWTLDINLDAPHFPHTATEDLWELYEGDLPEYGVEQPSAQHPYAEDLRRHFATDGFTPELTREHRRGYYARVTYIDRQLGRLVEKLEQTGQLDRTVVVYTSDHGEMLGKFGMWFKCSLYDDSVRVPLIVAGPGFDCGIRVSTPVTQWDLLASVFAAVDVSAPSWLRGAPLQGPLDPDRAAFAEYHGHGTRGSGYLVRQGRWKLIWNARAPHQLFDLVADPDELRDLAGDEPDVVRRLSERLRTEFCDPEVEHDRAEEFIQQQLVELRASRP